MTHSKMFSQINSQLGMNNSNHSFFLLMDDIENDSIRPCIEWIIDSNFSEEPAEMLNLMICSSGGDLNAGFALIDVMRGSHIPVRTIGIGQIASAGLMIFMAGYNGHRILTPNTAILSHQYSWGSVGKSHELIAATKAFDLTSNMLMNHYKKCSNLEEDRINKLLLPASDCWLSPQEALEYGLCDEIKELN